MMRLLGIFVLMASAVMAQQAATGRTFLYRLEPVRADFNLQAMTDAERPVVMQHAAYLRGLLDQGKLKMAGQAFDPKGFWGIVIVDAADLEAATAMMNADPAVQSKMFRATVMPFRVVFEKKE